MSRSSLSSLLKPGRRTALRRACLLALALPALGRAADRPAETPIPIAAFFEHPSLSGASLSPDGRRLAMLVNNSEGRDQLGVVELADMSIKVVASFANGDVGRFQWVNNGRLLYDSRDKHTAPGDEHYAPGLYAVNADGSGRRQLADSGGAGFVLDGVVERNTLPWNTYMLDQRGAQDSDWVYVESVSFGRDGPNMVELLHVNTVSGHSESVDGPGRTYDWWLDAKGRPALASTVEKNVEVLHYLDPATNRWRPLATRDAFLGSPGAMTPLGFAPDGTLYVTSRGRRDKSALFAYDLASGKIAAQPLVELDEYDFAGRLVTGAGKLLGVRYLADVEQTSWFDPAMGRAQEAVDQLLPGRVNQLSVGVRSETPYALVESWSDRQPPVFLLFNRDSGKLTRIGETRPAIPAARMAGLDLVRVKARDGRQIPTWVTVPNGGAGKRLPMVVLVHGGPYLRGGDWEWESERQFLASRGYVVLEPEFRGSTGYGSAHFRAGWKQWGLAMQDDIADATRWAIDKGIADPKRICIAGASYGGYATLMGLIRDPDLYKCGVEWAGVTDIGLLYNGHWSRASDMSDAYRRYGMPALVGDPVKDAAQFAQTSPLQQAARITQPLLLAYGGADRRVPIYHGKQFYDALRQTNKNVEWVVYEQEGHGWTLLQTKLDFWRRVETFLQRQIGDGLTARTQ